MYCNSNLVVTFLFTVLSRSLEHIWLPLLLFWQQPCEVGYAVW